MVMVVLFPEVVIWLEQLLVKESGMDPGEPGHLSSRTMTRVSGLGGVTRPASFFSNAAASASLKAGAD